MSDSEPLLHSESVSFEGDHVSVEVEHVANVNEATADRGPTVICRVCEREILLEGRLKNHVVRCAECNEATPIRAAPPGKKYVRCPCHCLLICKASSVRIACPRENCRRVITLAATGPNGTAMRAPTGTCRVQCPECQEIFMFNTLSNKPAHCPHCNATSSVGFQYKRSRAALFFVLFLAFVCVSIGLTVALKSTKYAALYVLTIGAYVGWIYALFKTISYARMNVSQVLGPV